MQLLVLILNKLDCMEDILKSFVEQGIKGATILDSVGMARVLTRDKNDELPLFGSLRMILNENRPFNKTIFVVLNDKQVPDAISSVKNILDLSKPDSGILFTLPISHVEGISQ